MRRRPGSRAALVLGVALLVSGCAAPTGEPGPTGERGRSGAPTSDASPPAPAPSRRAAPDGVLAEIVQLRGDVASGHIELRVTNGSDAPLTVERATYDSNRWVATMVRDDEAQIPPGQRRNLRMALPEPTCATSQLEHLATLELADGTALELVPSDPLDQLERLDDAVCDLRAWEERAAAVTWLEPTIPADGAGPAVVRLRVEPLGTGERATLQSFSSTVLVTPVDASGARVEVLPIERAIAPGDAAFVLEVPLEPGRCDLHAIAEDKQGTIFRLRATLVDEPIDLVLPAPEAQREALLDWVVERCAAQP